MHIDHSKKSFYEDTNIVSVSYPYKRKVFELRLDKRAKTLDMYINDQIVDWGYLYNTYPTIQSLVAVLSADIKYRQ